ncbi:MAG: hypothetical protein SPF66_05975 [Bacteroidaceae bacterium]|nr:hypothetical protein [Bacteroidaceae bacterium]
MSVATMTLIRLFCFLPIPHRQGGSAILYSRKRLVQRDEECHEMIIFADEMTTGRQVEIGGMKNLFQAGAKRNRQ